jgi:hypothetical protein
LSKTVEKGQNDYSRCEQNADNTIQDTPDIDREAALPAFVDMARAVQRWQKAFIHRPKYQRGNPEMSATKPTITVKSRLRNVGNGTLEVSDASVKFYVESGRFKKRRETVRDIPIADIQSVEQLNDDVSITWKENIDAFAVEQASQVEAILGRITASLDERRKTAETPKQIVEQKQNDLGQLVASAVDVADSAFNVLTHLNGRVDWTVVENDYLRLQETVGKLSSQNGAPVVLDVAPVSVALQQRYPKEIAERTLNVLKALYDGFNGGASSSVEGSEQPHPNQHDAKLQLQAFYVLGDMALGAVVGDEAVANEGVELLKLLEELAKLPSSKVDVNVAKSSVEKLSGGKKKQAEALGGVKSMLELQLKEQLVPAPVK